MDRSLANYSPLGSQCSGIPWPVTSFLSMIFLGVGNFLPGITHQQNPYLLKALVSVGFGLLGSCLALHYWISKSLYLKRMAHLSDSTIIRNGKVAPGMFYAILVGISNNFGYFCLFFGVSKAAENQGVIPIMLAGSAVVAAILVFFKYSEKLEKIQTLGMSICVAGLIVTAHQSWLTRAAEVYYAGLAALAFFTIRNLSLRASQAARLDPATPAVVSSLSEATGGGIMLFVLSFWVEIFEGMDYWGISFTGGICIAVGNLFLTHAVMHGKVGPAAMIANSSGVLQIMLEFTFGGFLPEQIIVIGSMICLVGVGVLLIGEKAGHAIARGNEEDDLEDYFTLRTR